MKKKINKIYKRIFSLELYEDLLVAVLRVLIVKPYYFFKNPIRAIKKISNGASKLFKLSTYENILIKTLRFFIKRSPLRLFNKKYALHHPYQSAGTSLATILLILGGAGYFLFSYYSSQASAWWNDDWLYRKQLTINSSQVTADLTNFPILVSITDGDLSSKAQTDGDDIVFTIDQGNQLDHEIESYDETTGTLTAWVKIPNLDGDQDSNFYVYYGNPTTDNMQKPEEVWDENFVMVQHLEENGTGTRTDSTRFNNDGTTSGYDGDEATDSGQINGADDFDNTNDVVNISDSSALGGMAQLTIETWVNLDQLPTTTGNGALLMEKRHLGSPYASYYIDVRDNSGNNRIYFMTNNSSETERNLWGSTNLSADTWYHVAGVYDGANLHVYLNGQNDDSGSQTQSGTIFDSDNVLGMNWLSDLDGILDEARVSSITRSDDWIETSFNNQDDPAAFLSVGAEEKGNSPVLYLPLDEGFGTTAHDESSAHNDATISGASWATEDMCKTGACLQFDGDDYLEIDDDDTLDLTNEMTMEAWVKPTATDKTNQTIISKTEKPDTPTKIYRSVGPSATTAITTGSSNEMTITGTTAQFQTALPTNVGVGDAIQYDDDNDGDIDTNDSIAFIKERVNNKEYKLQTSTGGVPTQVNKDTDWSLFRAYTSLNLAETGTENTGIDADLVNFDTWSDGKDISSGTGSNEQWNIACYANGTTADSTIVDISGWTTDKDNFIKVYTPVETSEVGATQRHLGEPDDGKYRLVGSANYDGVISLGEDYVSIVGLQIHNTISDRSSGINDLTSLTDNDNRIEISDNIIKSSLSGGTFGNVPAGIRIFGNYTEAFIWNNIIFDFVGTDGGSGISTANWNGFTYAYNNTIYNVYDGINSFADSQYYIIVSKNNNIQNCTSSCFVNANSLSSKNITESSAQDGAFGTTHSTGTTDGTTASKLVDSGATFITDGVQVGSIVEDTSNTQYTYVTAIDSETILSVNDDFFVSGENYSVYTNKYGSVTFENEGGDDFRLDQTDTLAINQGVDLSADSNLAFTTDIEGDERNFNDNWDIGADEYRPTEIYRSVGPGSTTALEEGTDNPMTIVGDTATFSSALADNIGVGDAIQYDDDDDGDIDSNDSIVFIHKRFSTYKFQIRNSSGGLPVEVSQDTDWSLYRAYASLDNTDDGTENSGIDSDLSNFDTSGRDLVTNDEQWNFACYANGTTADSAAGGYNSWTTGEQNYIKIYTPHTLNEVGTSQRHDGKWDTNKYRIEASSGNALDLLEDYMRVDGLQVKNTGTGDDPCIRVWPWENTSGSEIYISNTIVDCTGTTKAIPVHNSQSGKTVNAYIWNLIGFHNGSADLIRNDNTQLSTIYGYNITAVGKSSHSGSLLDENSAGDFKCTNCLAYASSGTGFDSGFDTGDINYCASSDSTADNYGGTGNRASQTFTFVDTGSDDYHLASNDAGALGYGTDLSNDPNLPFSTDIDDDKREGNWSIGADEGTPTKIYRSVGPSNTTALATGTDNDLTISGSTATFDEPLPDRIGVGDAIQYDDDSDGDIDANDSIVFIHGRTSSTEYTVKTAAGAAPVAVTNDNDWSIFRAYSSLYDAERGEENDGIDDDLEAFESWSSGKDLVTAGEQWNVACYGDRADTAAVTIDGWTTSEDNYIKVYTPVYTSEVGETQRHHGKWDRGKFIIAADGYYGVFRIYESYTKIEGLQIEAIRDTDTGIGAGIYINDGEQYLFNNNIIRATGSRSLTNGRGIYDLAGYAKNISAFNNIIYDFYESIYLRTDDNSTLLIYGNTLFNAVDDNLVVSMYGDNDTVRVKNNIMQDAGDEDYAEGSTASIFEAVANLTSDATSPNDTFDNLDVSFVNESGNDFRLAMSDTAAKGVGVNLYNDSNLPFTTDIEGEARPEAPSPFDIGADQISTTDHDNYTMSLFNDSAKVTASEEIFATFEEDIPANHWTHIAFARDSVDQWLYINGRQEETSTIENFLFDNNGKLYIGAQDDNSTNSFQGFLDEIRIYPYARSASEIRKDRAAASSGRAAQRASEGVGVAFGGGGENFMGDGLVGYWKMDESSWDGTTGEVLDYSGNNNHGTAADDATTVAGKFGNAGTFDGTDDYVDSGEDSSLSITEDLTIAAWLYNTGDLDHDTLVSKHWNGEYDLTFWSNELTWYNGPDYTNGNSHGFNYTFSTDTWYHVTVVRTADNKTVKLYVDGADIDDDFVYNDTPNQGSDNLFIGDREQSGSWFEGQIDEVRVYNRALSAREVKELYEWAPGPVMHLKMDEKVAGDAQTLYDISGNENNGTTEIGGNGTGMDCTALGKYGSACEFDGTDDYVETLSNIDEITATADAKFTFSFWINTTETSTDDLFAWSAYRSCGINYNSAGKISCSVDSDYSGSVISSTNVNDGGWHHISFVNIGNTQELFVDGVSESTASEDMNILWPTTAISIGNRPFGGYYNGLIDDVRIYNYARTQDQIIEDMNAGHPAGGSPVGSPVAYWKFDQGHGDTAYDFVGDNDGILDASTGGSNTTETEMWSNDAKLGKAIEFDGTDDYVDLQDTSIVDPEEGTMSAWFKTNNVANEQMILWVGDDAGNGVGPDPELHLFFDDNAGSKVITFYAGDSTSSAYVDTLSLPDLQADQWYHAVGTWKAGGTIAVYLDGKLVESDTMPTITDSAWDNIYAGRPGATMRYFYGLIDEVKIYNYAMTAAQAKTEFNMGKAQVMGQDPARDNDGTAVSGAAAEYCVPGASDPCDPPVGEWKFDEMSGTTAFDTSGNGNDGTLTDGPTWNPAGKLGSAINFDGNNDYVSVALPSVFDNIPANDFTFSMWFNSNYLGTAHDWDTIFEARKDDDNFARVHNTDTTGILGYTVEDSSTDRVVSSDFTLSTNTWYHLSGTGDASGNSLEMFIDGTKHYNSGSPGGAGYPGSQEMLYFGARTDVGSTCYNGLIDDVKIYDYVRTPAQIAWDFNRGKPIGHWKMDEVSGTQVDDWSGNANHGTMTDMDPGTDHVAGRFGNALDFDGSNDNVSAGSEDIYDFNGDFAISVWFKTSDVTGNDVLLGRADADYNLDTGEHGYYLLLNDDSGTDYVVFDVGGEADATYDGQLRWAGASDNEWHHAVGVKSGNSEYLYIDGNLEMSANVNVGDMSASGETLYIGNSRGAFSYFEGQIDDVRIYNYALTEQQIKDVMNQGSAVSFQ